MGVGEKALGLKAVNSLLALSQERNKINILFYYFYPLGT
jgi:hypothetical protein